MSEAAAVIRKWTLETSIRLPWPNKSIWTNSKTPSKSVIHSKRVLLSTSNCRSANAKKDWLRKIWSVRKRSARGRKRSDSVKEKKSKSSFLPSSRCNRKLRPRKRKRRERLRRCSAKRVWRISNHL